MSPVGRAEMSEGRIGGIEAEKVMVAVHHEEDVLFVKGVLAHDRRGRG
jgi:hypothetical protein